MSEPTLKPADVQPFKPSQAQALAKARLLARLAEVQGIHDLESLGLDRAVEWARDRRVRDWLRVPGFAAWFFDRDDFVHRAQSLKDLALETLEAVLLADLEPRAVTARDKLKAADMLLTLTGAYPAKASIRFLDRELDAMEPAEVDRQLDAARRQLEAARK